MTMFDYIKVDYPLPLEPYILAEYRPYVHAVINQDEFQTKDLACNLNKYYIDNNGHIFIDESNFEDNKESLKPIYYHGHINIYTLVRLDEDDLTSNRKFWLEYNLKLTDSRVVSAVLISPKREDMKSLLGSDGSSV